LEFSTCNPFTHERLQTYSYHSSQEIARTLEQAKLQYQQWKYEPLSKRAAVLKEFSNVLKNNKERLAQSMMLEMGKPLKEGYLEVEKSANTLDYVAEHFVDHFLAKQQRAHYDETSTQLRPLGVILAVMPWNYPLWQVIRVAATSFLLGNVLVLKHSDITAGTAELLAKLFSQVRPLLWNVRFEHSVTESVIADPAIQAVTFTGSTGGGSVVAQWAGKYLKKIVLELGGNDCYAVFADADLERAARVCVQSRLVNNGQSCVAAKRVLVHSQISSEFLNRVLAEIAKSLVGNPADKKVDRGPLAAKKFKQQLEEQYQQHLATGGRELFSESGQIFSMESNFYPVKILQTHLKHEHFLNHEYFGPVLQWVNFESKEDVVQAINGSRFGLGAALFSKDMDQCKQLAKHLEVGMIAINDSVRSDVRVPFGGVRSSGFGKELGFAGLMELANDQLLGISN
jgi:succinate-semialdehyde dehydrogenase/glutarate-semialdehyde dehydrogenase